MEVIYFEDGLTVTCQVKWLGIPSLGNLVLSSSKGDLSPEFLKYKQANLRLAQLDWAPFRRCPRGIFNQLHRAVGEGPDRINLKCGYHLFGSICYLYTDCTRAILYVINRIKRRIDTHVNVQII